MGLLELCIISDYTQLRSRITWPKWKQLSWKISYFILIKHPMHELKVLYLRRGCKIRWSEILKVNVFSRPLLQRNYIRGSISINIISFSRNCDIKQKMKSVTDACIWVMLISINSDTLEIRSIVCLTLILSFAAVEFISGQLISPTES